MRPGPLERILALGQQSPDQPAIEFAGGTHTYRELSELVLGWSSAIRSRGIERGAKPGNEPVGVAMAPSPELVVTVLAIQLAGYPCLPLPHGEVPPRRRNAIVEDGAPWLLIADEAGRQLYGEHSSLVGWEALWDTSTAASHDGSPGSGDDDLAYLIYTSGSTGKPKGVEMRWGAISNLVDWHAKHERLGKPARTALLTPLTFDVAFQEIFGTLVTGGTLVVLDPTLRRDPVSLARALRAQRVERLFLPFVGLQALADAANAFDVIPESLLDVVTAGEQLKVTPEIRRFFTALGGAALHNHYGPAETHVVTAHVLAGDPTDWPELPPIGEPIQGVEVLVLDAEGAEVPSGVEGEFFLGGACLAQGYHNRPDDTASRFVPDPRTGRTGRVYRTGDIGRQRIDGPYEWIGRSDDQVKVRGHRVELGEVESVLSRHEGVGQVVVVPRRDGASLELVAYVQGDPSAELGDEAVTDTLETWRGVWDQTYREATGDLDPTFDTSGWNSSHDGARLPAHHMREWVDATVERILALNPQRVLEIGCGTGLLLHRIAPESLDYTGIDYSQEVIDRLSATLAERTESRSAVSLGCAPAHEAARQVDELVDLVVMNSVLQHFPSPAYLLDVLEQAVSVTRPGGRVFIGDVTPYAFREAFFAWLEAPGGGIEESERVTVGERVQRRLALDRELTLDPRFFDLLGASLPRVSRVEVQARKGRERNELTDFRYDVIFHLDQANESPVIQALDWSALADNDRTLDAMLRWVRSGVRIRGVPNARTREAWQRADELSNAGPAEDEVFLDPNEIFVVAEQRGLALEVRPDTGSRTFTVSPSGAAMNELPDQDVPEDRPALLRRLSGYASNPLRDRAARDLFPRLREFATRELPDYLRPAAYVLLESFPRTTSGKVDRRRLPAPSSRRPELSTSFVAPGTDLEKTIETVWRDVLGLDRVGIDDSFFDLGGNSLGVVTLAAKLGNALGREIPIVMIFAQPTVRSLATQLASPTTLAAAAGRGNRGAMTRDAYRHRRNRRVSREQR